MPVRGRAARLAAAGRLTFDEHLPPARDIAGLDLSRELEVEQFPGGHSNLTYLVRFGDDRAGRAAPPFGPVAPTAHDMAREYRWLAALHPVFPLAPRPYLLCEDPASSASVFYVMERRRGLVVRHEEPPELADRPDAGVVSARRWSTRSRDLHAIDVATARPAGLGKPAGFVGAAGARLDRALAPFEERASCRRWTRSPSGCRRVCRPIRRRRRSSTATSSSTTSCSTQPTSGRLVAVFDWEMSALGDPLVDLGILLAYWVHDRAARAARRARARSRTGPAGSRATRSSNATPRAAGRDLSAIRFYETFARFKMAVVIQQIFFRYRARPDRRPAVRGVRRARRVARARGSRPGGAGTGRRSTWYARPEGSANVLSAAVQARLRRCTARHASGAARARTGPPQAYSSLGIASPTLG